MLENRAEDRLERFVVAQIVEIGAEGVQHDEARRVGSVSNRAEEKSQMRHVKGTKDFDAIERFLVELVFLVRILNTREALQDHLRKHARIELSIGVKEGNISLHPSHFRRTHNRCNYIITHLEFKIANKDNNTLP